jgi:hypothetical protein
MGIAAKTSYCMQDSKTALVLNPISWTLMHLIIEVHLAHSIIMALFKLYVILVKISTDLLIDNFSL